MATQKLLSSLGEPDHMLVRESAAGEISGLDEDALLDLHARVRRARNKHVGLYRRHASARVSAKGARGQARGGNERNAARAEIFEDALARVSRQLAVAARQSARDLKDERLAQARQDPDPPASSVQPPRTAGVQKRVLADKTRKSPGRKKREAGSIAAGARRQAKRDSR